MIGVILLKCWVIQVSLSHPIERYQKTTLPTNLFSLLLGNVLQKSNNISPLLRLLQPRKRHLRSRNILFRILQIFEEGLIGPGDTFGFVGVGVLVIGEGTGFATEETV